MAKRKKKTRAQGYPGSEHGPSVKNPATHEALKGQGFSKSSAAAISNAALNKGYAYGVHRGKDDAMRDQGNGNQYHDPSVGMICGADGKASSAQLKSAQGYHEDKMEMHRARAGGSSSVRGELAHNRAADAHSEASDAYETAADDPSSDNQKEAAGLARTANTASKRAFNAGSMLDNEAEGMVVATAPDDIQQLSLRRQHAYCEAYNQHLEENPDA